MPAKILIIDDEQNILLAFSSLLTDQGYVCNTAASAEDALKKTEQKDYDLILLDLNLPKMSGIDFLKQVQNKNDNSVIIVISGQSEISTALEAVRLGAIDYLEKPVSPERLIASVRIALLVADSKRHRAIAVEEIKEQNQIIGKSAQIKSVLKLIKQMAPTDSTVLITGENGTGKELVAASIFLGSKRKNNPYIKVNCPGIPTTLFESELFGHKKGAYTGAVKDYPGKFLLADKGTLFLDEIGDLPLECQAKLLRVIEAGTIEPLGATKSYQTDVRIICATNRNLNELIKIGKFREDLYYRISVLSIEIPPLRKRLDDIPALIGSFLNKYDPSGLTTISGDALAFLSTLDYPGNVRQLKNMIERLLILTREKTIEVEHLYNIFPTEFSNRKDNSFQLSLSEKIKNFEKQIIANSLKECESNISKTAAMLKTDRSHISRKIKEYNLGNDD